MKELCPGCGRLFERILDYPLVFVRKVEILSIPEVMDFWSEAAMKARLARGPLPKDNQELLVEGINRTPEVAAAYESLQNYFRSLEGHQGQEVPPTELVPPLEPHQSFKWAYHIPGFELYIALSEAETAEAERICEVVIYGQGPNLGSAGGPTLQAFGAVAAIHYEGRLLGTHGRNSDLQVGAAEHPFERRYVANNVPEKAGVYLILQSVPYPRYKGATRILKIGCSGSDLRGELLNHFGRHTVSNRLKRLARQPGQTITFSFQEAHPDQAVSRERDMLRRFEDDHWDLPLLNAQRGYYRGQDWHYTR